MQSKRIFNLSDLVDKRDWFITKFNEASQTVEKIQASSIKQFDYKTTTNIREKLVNIRQNDSLNN